MGASSATEFILAAAAVTPVDARFFLLNVASSAVSVGKGLPESTRKEECVDLGLVNLIRYVTSLQSTSAASPLVAQIRSQLANRTVREMQLGVYHSRRSVQ